MSSTVFVFFILWNLMQQVPPKRPDCTRYPIPEDIPLYSCRPLDLTRRIKWEETLRYVHVLLGCPAEIWNKQLPNKLGYCKRLKWLQTRTCNGAVYLYRGDDKSLARPTSLCILFDGENISFDASLHIYINSANIPPIMIMNGIYETQNLLSL
jgi:hypothetical protein